jgi:hypothetical protein
MKICRVTGGADEPDEKRYMSDEDRSYKIQRLAMSTRS